MILQQKQFDIPEIGVLTVLWATVDTLLNTTKEGTTAARQIGQTSQQTQFWWKRIKIFVQTNLFWEAVWASWRSTLFDVPNYQYFALNYQHFPGKKQIRLVNK